MMCEVVRVGVRAKIGADKKLTLFVVPHICDALTAQLTKGIVQVVTNPEDEGNLHYLPQSRSNPQ